MDRMDGLTETPVSTISDIGPSAGTGVSVFGVEAVAAEAILSAAWWGRL
jgi:hypothetical protein